MGCGADFDELDDFINVWVDKSKVVAKGTDGVYLIFEWTYEERCWFFDVYFCLRFLCLDVNYADSVIIFVCYVDFIFDDDDTFWSLACWYGVYETIGQCVDYADSVILCVGNIQHAIIIETGCWHVADFDFFENGFFFKIDEPDIVGHLVDYIGKCSLFL